MKGLFIEGNSLKVTLVAVLVFLLSLSTQTVVPLEAAYVTQPQTHSVPTTGSSSGSATPNLVSSPLVRVGFAVSQAFTSSSNLGFELTGNIYDNSGAGFMIAHRSNVTRKIVFVIADLTRVNIKTHGLTFTDYGNALLVGGRNANPTTKFYEDAGAAPLVFSIIGANAVISHGATQVLNVPVASLTPSDDYFIMESLNDNGHTVIILWGINQYGTYASGVYFDLKFGRLSALGADSYVIHWRDTNGNGVADLKDTFDVAFSGTQNPLITSPTVPTLPAAAGCYHQGTLGWVSNSCLSKAQIAQLEHPSIQLGTRSAVPLKEGAASGVWGLAPDLTQNPYGILSGGVQMLVWGYFGETDTSNLGGDGAFSVQVNTNQFTGTDGLTDWVQFTLQQYGEVNNWRVTLCVWEISQANLGPNANYNQYTQCSDLNGPGGYWKQSLTTGYYLVLTGVIMKYSNALGVFAYGNQLGSVSVVAPDYLGLGLPYRAGFSSFSHWLSVSGTILGVGDGGEALFGYDNNAGVFAEVESAVWFSCGDTCNPLSYYNGVDFFVSTNTAESNNLDYYGFVVPYPGSNRPPVYCDGVGTRCWIDTDSTTPGAPPPPP